MRIVVSGMVAGDPGQGGATWAVLQYVLGLRELGYDVALVEPVDALAQDAVAYFHGVVAAFDLGGRATLLARGTGEFAGAPPPQDADLLLNVSGMLTEAGLLDSIPIRVYLDLDPAFNQLWQEAEGIDMRFDGHTHFVTVGQAVGGGRCSVPTCGREWIPTLPPVVLEQWPRTNGIERDALTTVGNWRGYGSIEHEGVHYGQKAHSLRQLLGLPRRTRARFQLALAIDPGETRDLAALAEHGWELLDPTQEAGTTAAYQSFVRGSRAELGLAKSGYVRSRCGWFSDRSACYLASGRPVVAQETGFSDFLPTGEGLLVFSDEDGAAAAVEQLQSDYTRHARAAREIAEEHLDSRRVLTRLLERVGA